MFYYERRDLRDEWQRPDRNKTLCPEPGYSWVCDHDQRTNGLLSGQFCHYCKSVETMRWKKTTGNELQI